MGPRARRAWALSALGFPVAGKVAGQHTPRFARKYPLPLRSGQRAFHAVPRSDDDVFVRAVRAARSDVAQGVGREAAHEVIKEHATKAALSMREGEENLLLDALAEDPRIPLNRSELQALISDPIEFTGAAKEQISRVVNRIEAITAVHSDAAKYQPGAIR